MPTKDSRADFASELNIRYTSALQDYLESGQEESLSQAYELGRSALIAGLGILDIVELHHQALSAALRKRPPAQANEQMQKATIFFEESLSPFEITHQGYRDAVEIMRRVTSFAFMASHEVKGPLTSILSSASMLQELLAPDPGGTEEKLLANVIRAVAVLKSRTDDMLDIASMYAGALRLRISPVKMRPYLQRVYEQLETEVRWKGLSLDLIIDTDLPNLEIDPDRIQQVITNLVQNAVKYAPDGRQIELHAAAQGGDVLIQVQDHGRGFTYPIAPGSNPSPSQRPGDRLPQPHGTGLGLLLCQQIVEAHHGRLDLISMPGQGSTLQVWLPIATQPGMWNQQNENAHR